MKCFQEFVRVIPPHPCLSPLLGLLAVPPTKMRVGGSQELFSAWRLIQSLLGSCVSIWIYMSGIGNVIWLCILTRCLGSRGITERVFSPVRYLTQPAWYSAPRCWVLSRIHLGWFVVGYSLY